MQVGSSILVSCSCRFLLLEVDRTLLEERLAVRCNHFMPLSLLNSQLLTLEGPEDEPDVTTISIGDRNVTPRQIAEKARELLGILNLS